MNVAATQHRLLGWLIATALALCPTSAYAAPPSETPENQGEDYALELFKQGHTKFEAGDFDGAIADFESAFALLDEPNLLYNIAQAYARKGDFSRAVESLDRYRARAPKAEYDDIDRQREQWLGSIKPEPAPLPEPEPEPAEPEPQPEPAAPAETADQKAKIFGIGPAVMTAVAAAGLGIGLGLGLASRRARRQAEDLCANEGGVVRCRDGFADKADRNTNLALGANISLAIGGTAALATILWVSVNAGKRPQRKRRASVVPVLNRQHAGVAATVRF